MDVDELFSGYAAAVVSLDAAKVLPFFDFPVMVSGATGSGATVVVLDKAGFADSLGGLLHAYRSLDVAAATVLSATTFELSEWLHQVSVRWEFADERGDPIYEIDATYTIVGGRIRAIAHNEIPEMMAALAAKT
jgi:hypothetical protein